MPKLQTIITTVAIFATMTTFLQIVNQPKVEKLTVPIENYKSAIIYIPAENYTVSGKIKDYKVFTGTDLIEITFQNGYVYVVDIENVILKNQ